MRLHNGHPQCRPKSQLFIERLARFAPEGSRILWRTAPQFTQKASLFSQIFRKNMIERSRESGCEHRCDSNCSLIPQDSSSQLFELRTRACKLVRLISLLNHPSSPVSPHHTEVRERACAESPDATLASGHHTVARRQTGARCHCRRRVACQWLLRTMDTLVDGQHVNLNGHSERLAWRAAKAEPLPPESWRG